MKMKMKMKMNRLLLTGLLVLTVNYSYAENEHISPFGDDSFNIKSETLPPSEIFQEKQDNESVSDYSNNLPYKKISAPGPGDRPGSGEGIGQEGTPPVLSLISGDYFLLLLAASYIGFRFRRRLFHSNSNNELCRHNQARKFVI